MESTMISDEKNRAPCSEASHSNRANDHRRGRKRKTQHAPSSSCRGVVQQPNGKWGAQIYAGNSRIWIGTFQSENEAAAAYNSASLLLKPNDNQGRNLPCDFRRSQEQGFQKNFTEKAILGMLKDGSYESRFQEYLMEGAYPAQESQNPTALAITSQPTHAVGMATYGSGSGSTSGGVFKYTKLFQKELMPSDVGKLNRLVIPKKHAVRCFPHVDHVAPTEESDDRIEAPAGGDEGDVGGGVGHSELVFSDRSTNKLWKFRYCYWASSQSYVFTKGWKRYVKEKDLKTRDVVTFYRYQARNEHSREEVRAFFVIDVLKMRGTQATATVSAAANDNDVALLPEAIGEPFEQQDSSGAGGKATAPHHGHPINSNPSVFHDPMHQEGDDAPLNKGFMLFGVHISPST